MRVDVSLLRQDLRKVVDRVTETETRISTAEDEITTLKSQVTQSWRIGQKTLKIAPAGITYAWLGCRRALTHQTYPC